MCFRIHFILFYYYIIFAVKCKAFSLLYIVGMIRKKAFQNQKISKSFLFYVFINIVLSIFGGKRNGVFILQGV